MPTLDIAQQHLTAAREAHARGDFLLHIHLDVSMLTGETSSWGSWGNSVSSDQSVGYFLSDVERIGWRLEHTGYAYIESGATTSARIFGSGSGVVNHGGVAGYFTFRRIDQSTPESPAATPAS